MRNFDAEMCREKEEELIRCSTYYYTGLFKKLPRSSNALHSYQQ
jgi:hypothetical protein